MSVNYEYSTLLPKVEWVVIGKAKTLYTEYLSVQVNRMFFLFGSKLAALGLASQSVFCQKWPALGLF